MQHPLPLRLRLLLNVCHVSDIGMKAKMTHPSILIRPRFLIVDTLQLKVMVGYIARYIRNRFNCRWQCVYSHH